MHAYWKAAYLFLYLYKAISSRSPPPTHKIGRDRYKAHQLGRLSSTPSQSLEWSVNWWRTSSSGCFAPRIGQSTLMVPSLPFFPSPHFFSTLQSLTQMQQQEIHLYSGPAHVASPSSSPLMYRVAASNPGLPS
jgi:hypothetical protein